MSIAALALLHWLWSRTSSFACLRSLLSDTLSIATRSADSSWPGLVPGKPSLASPRARLGRLNQIIACNPSIAAFGACNNPRVSLTQPAKRPTGLAIFLVIAGIVGFVSAWQLTIDKFQVLTDPSSKLNCDISVIVACGPNLFSWQGSVFGFPNPMLGIAGFVAPIAVGVGILAGARFTRGFWVLFNLGLAGAFAFVCWLIGQSIFSLGTLCTWCMAVWSVTIPLFWTVTLYNLKTGNIPVGAKARRFFAAVYGWVPLITLLSYVVVAVLAQLRLDVIATL